MSRGPSPRGALSRSPRPGATARLGRGDRGRSGVQRLPASAAQSALEPRGRARGQPGEARVGGWSGAGGDQVKAGPGVEGPGGKEARAKPRGGAEARGKGGAYKRPGKGRKAPGGGQVNGGVDE